MSATAPNYNHTVTACFVGYIAQAVINNFMPLLFVTFAATLGIDMARLSALITVNFVTQLIVDVLAGKFVDRIGYKPCIIAAHLAALAGLLALGLLPPACRTRISRFWRRFSSTRSAADSSRSWSPPSSRPARANTRPRR